ncbi:hypothetical protein [Verminephrobacter eiseniae]|uniref:hypothetical protein n=1 Tax=Verminephrobacter eiseniae TaxID=364317 RepID=UPI0010E4744B|nr:hypothetical protein [Verminephrobacter eiseniae]KAB7598113.1 hypothetical protein ET532_011830 [Verminephrobacter sp. Larva24]
MGAGHREHPSFEAAHRAPSPAAWPLQTSLERHRFSSGKAAPLDDAHPFGKGFDATEKTKKPEPVLKPIRALLPDASLAALAAGVV